MRRSFFHDARTALARIIAPGLRRGFDAASGRRFPREARMGRPANETLAAARAIRSRARYMVSNDAYACAGVAALRTYGWGAGAMFEHADADAFHQWGLTADADGVQTFDAMIDAAIGETATAGESFIVFVQREDGLFLRLLPAEQLDESKTAQLGDGGRIDSGVETDASGRRMAYWFLPSLPATQFETAAPSVRVLAEDVVHLFRPMFVGQPRGLSWLAPVLLKLNDLSVLSDALLKNSQVSALNSVYLIDRDGLAGAPFDGEQRGDELDVSLEPGAARILRGNWDMKANTPLQAQQSIEFANMQINAIAAALGVCAHLVSGDVSKANYSSLRADLLKMKASIESWQWSMLAPALLKIWNRWALTNSLRGDAVGDALPEIRFPAMPSADIVKDAQYAEIMLRTKLASRAELVAGRGESVERVNADIANDPHAAAADPANDNKGDTASHVTL